MLSTAKKQVAFGGLKNKKSRSALIPSSITLGGTRYDVTEISKKAFHNCRKLKTITIRSTKLKKIGANAFTGTSANIKIKVPKSKMKKYKTLFPKRVSDQIKKM